MEKLNVRSQENRLNRKDFTTEGFAAKSEVPEWGERRKLPRKVSELRRKLYQKAKRELVQACGELHGSAGCGKSARPVRRGRGS